jgi:two-component system nitrogen regulation sensor histidine kinase NtrY
LRRKAKKMTCNVRINPHIENNTEGYIMTFDDISELLSAQRSAAWSDVAQRIAHEIKNPLTPINLSAQRLAKKFRAHIPDEDMENFVGYTDTITRHTADIARIIGEFSDFAKLPSPRFKKTDLSKILKDSVFSARVAHSRIDFTLDMPDLIEVMADSGQISQVMTNLLKNASESVTEKRSKTGLISVKADVKDKVVLTIEDNGGGFPPDLLDRLTEPYVTTRAKGTGLGLAIVKKIVEDHGGQMDLSNTRKGAKVTITLPSLES